jgi:beta-phosphoglucomutase-like phosphatase (HAD superfamily)
VQAVVFDFDGVLADTEGLHFASFQDVFAPRGWTLTRDAYFADYLGFGDRDLIAQDRRIIDGVGVRIIGR